MQGRGGWGVMGSAWKQQRSCQRLILQFGNACWSFFTPALVTCVPRSDKLLRSISLLRCASPASVTRVLSRDSIAEARRSFESSDRRPPAHGAGGRKGAGGAGSEKAPVKAGKELRMKELTVNGPTDHASVER